MKKKNIFWILSLAIVGAFIILSNSCKKDDDENFAVKDADGNGYHSVTIGTQVWLVENLRTTKFNDGSAIPVVTDKKAWEALTTAGVCTYNNTSNSDTINNYGRLYNWFAVNSGKLGPKGWHVATEAEWNTLITYLGGETVAGGHLKELGTTHWTSPNTGADNTSGFTALPGSFRNNDGTYGGIGDGSNWWTSTESSTLSAWYRGVYSDSSYINKYSYYKTFGFSVRCLKD
jgi:uncharacterized protein (TIGR02145 family)